MVTLALRLQDQFPKHYPLFSTRTFTWGGDTYRNHNTLLFGYRGLDGMKTGYTRASGFNLVASARRGKRHVIVAYFGGKTSASRNAAVRAQLDAGFTKAAQVKTRQPGPLAAPTNVAQAKAPAAASTPAPKAAQALPEAANPDFAVERVRPVLVPGAPSLELVQPERPLTRAKAVEVAAEPTPSVLAAAAPQGSAPVPAHEPAGAAAGPFQIQVGAFNSQDEAERQLAAVRERAGTLLQAHAGRMSQVKRGDKVLFRARYVGFGAQSAAAGVCSELKLLEIDCVVMRAE
jgi:D-alanyl-D-alanine carboxypeptidase